MGNKKYSHIYFTSVIYYCMVCVVSQVGLSFLNISNYYQIVSFLNTRSNILIIYLIVFFIILNKNKILKPLWLLLLLFVIILNGNFVENNKLLFDWMIQSPNNLNMNLMNGIMLIHPMILYLFYAYYLYVISFGISRMRIKTKYYANPSKYLDYINISLIIFSIILGCWWAEQELSWGGWWSWDFVELLALNFFLYFYSVLHQSKTTNFMKTYNHILISLVIILVAIMSVRFNIINSIHNFVNLQSQNQYFFYIVTVVLALTLIMFESILKTYKSKEVSTLYYLVIVCILYLYIVFFYDLVDLSIFEWNNLKLITMHNLYIYIVVLLLLLYLLKCGTNLNYYSLLLLCIALNWNTSHLDVTFIVIIYHLIMSNVNFSKNKDARVLHICILTYLYVTFYQIYTFDKSVTCFIQRYNYILKSSNQSTLSNSYTVDYGSDFFNSVGSNIYYIQNIRCNPKPFSNDFFKNVFEKKIYLTNKQISEFYSYNLQELLQLSGLCIYVLLFLMLVSILMFFIRKSQLVVL